MRRLSKKLDVSTLRHKKKQIHLLIKVLIHNILIIEIIDRLFILINIRITKKLYMQDLSLKSFDRNPASINLNYNKIQ